MGLVVLGGVKGKLWLRVREMIIFNLAKQASISFSYAVAPDVRNNLAKKSVEYQNHHKHLEQVLEDYLVK